MELVMDVRKKFGDFQLDAGFSLAGDHVGIFGESGSGKSTLVGMLAGLIPPDDGEIRLDGETLFSSRDRIALPPERRRIAMVFQHASLFPHLDVEANLMYGFRRCEKANRRITLAPLVSVLKLDGLLKRGVNKLSGGERQRVALGRAILSNPRLLLMDEPLSALDDSLKYQIMHYLKSASEEFGIPYLFISHSLLEIRLMTSRVLAVGGGRVLRQATPEEVARERMGQSQVGYINLLPAELVRRIDGLYQYRWGSQGLFISAGTENPSAMFELSSRDIILFKKHPEAISARNLLQCRVSEIFPSGNKVGVEMSCGGMPLVAEVVRPAAEELDIRAGSEIYAVVKASSFRRLG
ncbi:molybdenum ABC transporter ATP-binding protein [Geomonas sp. Red32]|uniref:molybdenum ABC transporter ATP-binding protein n=1 Tax=Geomonas sp. Red32 TaxID=2912856 RepID=UPI00202CD113|nr:molybdenum ABC transporter ATP-binding protein [Geomonas sp. Red32]MCM0083280.1 molybdenum ABC transporter ATP-binding protein [Geomonas sp. Red32]